MTESIDKLRTLLYKLSLYKRSDIVLFRHCHYTAKELMATITSILNSKNEALIKRSANGDMHFEHVGSNKID